MAATIFAAVYTAKATRNTAIMPN